MNNQENGHNTTPNSTQQQLVAINNIRQMCHLCNRETDLIEHHCRQHILVLNVEDIHDVDCHKERKSTMANTTSIRSLPLY